MQVERAVYTRICGTDPGDSRKRSGHYASSFQQQSGIPAEDRLASARSKLKLVVLEEVGGGRRRVPIHSNWMRFQRDRGPRVTPGSRGPTRPRPAVPAVSPFGRSPSP